MSRSCLLVACAFVLLGAGASFAQEADSLFVRVQSLPLHKLPEGSETKDKLSFKEPVVVLKRSLDWLKIETLDKNLQGWVPLVALTASKDELADLEAKGRVPRSIVLLEGRIGPLQRGVRNVNLVGSQRVDFERFEKEAAAAKLNPKKKLDLFNIHEVGDCLLLNAGALAELRDTKKTFHDFFAKWGATKIAAPKAGTLYYFTDAKRFEPLAVTAPDNGRLQAMLEQAAAPRWAAARAALAAAPAALPELDRLEGHKQVNYLSFSADGTQLISCGNDGSIRFWDVRTGSEVQRQQFENYTSPGADKQYPLGRIALIDKGRQWLLLTRGGSQVTLLDNVKHTLSEPKAPLHGGIADWCIRPTGEILILTTTAEQNKTSALHIWDFKKPKALRTIPVKTGFTYGAAFSPDGRSILSGSDTELALWETATGKLVRRLAGHTGPVTRVVFSPDGTKALSSSQDQTVRYWDVKTGNELHKLATGGYTAHLAFSGDGQAALCTVAGKLFGWWDLGTGKELGQPIPGAAADPLRDAAIATIAVSLDGRLAATADAAGAIKLWLLPPR